MPSEGRFEPIEILAVCVGARLHRLDVAELFLVAKDQDLARA
jgi:hypothetical protein